MPVNASNDNLGWLAPSFKLKDISGEIKSLDDLKGNNGTVIAFICNHCPYVIAIAERLSFEARELEKLSINTITIMSNDVSKSPDDSFEKMKIFSHKYNFSFCYLYDETQGVAKSFKAACTPEFYLFNNEKTLEYRGRLDNSSPGNGIEPSGIDLRDAIEKLLNGKEVNQAQHPSMGCNIKWK